MPPRDFYERVGDRVRKTRELRGLTQEQLGSAIGLSPPQLSRYETGARPVSLDVLRRLASHLNAPELLDLSRESTLAPAPQAVPPSAPSANEEAAMLKDWRPLEPRSRAIVADILKVLRRHREK